MITRPLQLLDHVKQPAPRFNTVPLVDLALILFCFALFHSKFVFAPGLTIDVRPVDLPGVQSVSLSGIEADAVLTIRPNGMLLFEGTILDGNNFTDYVAEYVGARTDVVILVWMDRDVSVQALLDVCEKARAAGVAQIQLAAEPGFSSGGPVIP
ncbi:MAG: biopolymer transporter ExbD [Opitutales bacterium]